MCPNIFKLVFWRFNWSFSGSQSSRLTPFSDICIQSYTSCSLLQFGYAFDVLFWRSAPCAWSIQHYQRVKIQLTLSICEGRCVLKQRHASLTRSIVLNGYRWENENLPIFFWGTCGVRGIHSRGLTSPAVESRIHSSCLSQAALPFYLLIRAGSDAGF